MQFKFEISRPEEQNLVFIKLSGNLLERYDATDYLNEISSFIEQGIAKFILDLSKLEYINSNGLSVLINTLTKARNAGGDVVIFGVSERLRQLFIITKLDNVFRAAVDEQSAKTLLLN
jgi:anti-sigma B factor antagonist